MPLTRVTITGADDGVDPERLFELSKDFPYAEWGVLHSMKRQGEPRYPTDRWLEKLHNLVLEYHGSVRPHLSAHLCGELARRTLSGEEGAFLCHAWPFDRVQLNGFGWVSWADETFLELLKDHRRLEFIAQLGADLVSTLRAAVLCQQSPNLVGLFDASGGEGKRPAGWPCSPSVHLRCGYAGGITPENVVEVLDSLSNRADSFWIDVESGARSDDRFDLDRVHALLAKAANYIGVYE